MTQASLGSVEDAVPVVEHASNGATAPADGNASPEAAAEPAGDLAPPVVDGVAATVAAAVPAPAPAPATPPLPRLRFAVVENPLLVAWSQVTRAYWAGRIDSDRMVELRRECVESWSWAVPNETALKVLSGLGPIVEIGAGTGYWSKLLRARGVDVVAYDRMPGVGCSWERRASDSPVLHTQVLAGEPEVLKVHPDRALLIIWPPHMTHEYAEDPGYVSFGTRCLRAYKGRTVVYVGEPKRVAAQDNRPSWTGDDTFFAEMARDYVAQQWVAIPRWPGLHDAMWVVRRKGGPR
jgi:hypothetical protein